MHLASGDAGLRKAKGSRGAKAPAVERRIPRILRKQPSIGAPFDREKREKLVATYLASAEKGEMGGQLLDVQPCGAASAKMFNEVEGAEFRGVIDAMKHALAGKHTGGADTIESSHEFAISPRLNAVRVTPPVELDIRSNHRRCDPSSALAGTPGTGACGNHGFERFIDRESQSSKSTSGLAQIARHMESVEFEDRPSGWAHPRNGAERA